jgi:hypothetical protein
VCSEIIAQIGIGVRPPNLLAPQRRPRAPRARASSSTVAARRTGADKPSDMQRSVRSLSLPGSIQRIGQGRRPCERRDWE